jgi:hypothetical protein
VRVSDSDTLPPREVLAATHVDRDGRVAWFATIDDFNLACRFAGDGPIPVLRPERHDQADLWGRIIETQFVQAPRLERSDRRVIAWGDRAAGPAAVYARWSASSLAACSTLDEIIADVHRCRESGIVVVALASQLLVAAIARISSAARASRKTVGFLCGRTDAGLSFSVAKALLQPVTRSNFDIFDAPHHDPARNKAGTPEEICERLRRPALFKAIRSHGEGSHAKLPGVVICGLLDDAEFPDAPDQGCSRDGARCKRGHSFGARVVYGDQLVAPVIGFACCNGFNVAAELYPSPTSIALSLIEGWAGAVIAPMRPLTVPDHAMDRLCSGLAGGEPLGVIVQALDELSERSGEPNAFVLHGDPLYALPRLDAARPGRSTEAGQVVTAPAIEDAAAAADLAVLQTWLIATGRQTVQGRRIVRSLKAWLGESESEAVEPLAARLDRIESMVLNAMKWAETRPVQASLQALRRSTMAVRLSVAQWDREVAAILLGARRRVDAFDVGHYDQVRIDIAHGPACRRCATPIEVHRFGRGVPAEEHRIATLCCVCGPLETYRAAGPRLVIADSPKTGLDGDIFSLRAMLQIPADLTPLVGSAQILLRFYDKTRDCCVHEEARSVAAESQPIDFRFQLPASVGRELHSIHLIAACGFDIAYARARFASLPAHANAPAHSSN